jgi:alkylhydroperoxidase family enzyme
MLNQLILKRLDTEERKLGASLDYLRRIMRASLAAFFKFSLFTPMSNHRKALAAAPYHVARLVATRHEDCGTCVQIAVNLARRDGVEAETLRAVLNRRPESLSPQLADVYHFTQSVVEASGEEENYRERLEKLYGERGMVELALAIASARVYPTVKRALGYAKSCSLVTVEV